MTIHELEEIDLNRTIELSPQKLEKKVDFSKDKPLHIVFLMVWTKVCGGSKIILEYSNKISEKGHNITIVSYDNKPTWFNMNSNINFVQVPNDKDWKDYIPNCDVIVATSWKCIYTAIESQKAPVTFFEQGGSHIFDIENLSERKKEVVQNRLNLVPFIYTVSTYTKDKIKEAYSRDSAVICNAVESNIFYPRKCQTLKENDVIDITIIGSEDFKFKNIENILQAIRILKKDYNNLNLNWITQTPPTKNTEPAIVNPKQDEIGNILRKTDIYICNSVYESFGLPTLEAMTCGAAVITTDTGGMRDFVEDGYNALITKQNDINDIVEKTKLLIENKELRNILAQNGVETAKKFNWENSVLQTISYYYKIAEYQVKK